MSGTHSGVQKSFFGSQLYFYLAIGAAIPVYLITHIYVDSIHVHEDEAVATGATACFIAGVFSGRYIAQIWTSRLPSVPRWVIVALSALIIACISWLFFHADFPVGDRTGVNFLLFFLPFVAISMALGMLMKMVRAIAQQQVDAARAGEAQSKSELHLLQSQISPHFLFNTLNNLYGLSITQHEKVPPLILKLSELLRYSVYDATGIFVPLQDEMAYINNYIEFEKIRIGDRLALTTAFEEIGATQAKIAPMLLIVLIENAFKHAKNSGENRIYIEITLRTWASSILFSVKNSHSKSTQDQAAINKSSGFGLSSVTKRLALLYPGQHELKIEDAAAYYNVMLQLKMK